VGGVSKVFGFRLLSKRLDDGAIQNISRVGGFEKRRKDSRRFIRVAGNSTYIPGGPGFEF
jgi:hypothetical protein